MSNPTSNFGWQMPTNTDLVTNLPADFEVFGQAVDTDFADLKGGTTGQILSKNSNTDLDFIWIANDQGDITGVTATSPLTGGGTSGAITVGIQSASTSQSGAVQLENSTSSTSTTTAAVPASVKSAYDLAAAAIPKSTVTTNGDILYATGSSAVTRLGVGTSGQVLTVSGGIPSWATPASGGGMTLLSTTTLSGATTTISSISGSYNKLRMFIYGVSNSTAAGTFRVAPNAVTNLIYSVGNYYYGNNVTAMSGREGEYITITQATSGGRFKNDSVGNAITIEIDNYASSTANKAFQAYGAFKSDNSTYYTGFTMGGFFLSTTAITSLEFSNSGGNFSAGTVLLYGVK